MLVSAAMRSLLALTAVLWASACTSEPIRPMAPELDPASPRAPVPSYQPAPNPLVGEVRDAPGGATPADPHAHHRQHAPAASGEAAAGGQGGER